MPDPGHHPETPPPNGPNFPTRRDKAHLDAAFKVILTGSTAVGAATVFGSLACLERSPNQGLDFHWRWAALPWMVLGALAACYFWRLVWRAGADTAGKGRTRLRRYGLVVMGIALAAFAYPIRFVADENIQDVLIGLGAAAAVLTLIGWMMFRLVRLFTRDERKQKDEGIDG